MKKNEKGVALIIVLISLAILIVLGFMLVQMASMNVETSVEARSGLERFYGAEGGIYSVASWMTFFRRFDLPEDVTNPQNPANYYAILRVLGESIRYQPGYSALWKGSDVLINSKAPPDNPRAEIEAVVFIPVAPVGYGNE